MQNSRAWRVSTGRMKPVVALTCRADLRFGCAADPLGLWNAGSNAAKAQRELEDVTPKLEEIFDGLSTDVLETQLGAIHRRPTKSRKSNWTLITRE